MWLYGNLFLFENHLKKPQWDYVYLLFDIFCYADMLDKNLTSETRPGLVDINPWTFTVLIS